MKLTPVFLSAVLFLVVTGCGSQRKVVTNYYLIENPDSAEISIVEKEPYLNGFCEISPIQVNPAYATQKIAIRSNTREIKYYSYHYWAQRPEESIALMLEDYFSQSSVFNGVSTRYWRLTPDYKILTTVYQLEMAEQDGQVSAHLSLELKLIDSRENRIILVHRADRYQHLAKKDINLFAQFIGKLVFDELNNFSERIIQSVEEKNKPEE